MDGELLAGSKGREILRVGDTVRRPVGPWTPSVHALLRHLEAVGFDGAPRLLGVEDGCEVLTYVPGREGRHVRQGSVTLVRVGQLIRRFHDAVSGFVPPSGLAGGRTIMCHGDLAPYNTIYTGSRPIAFIDWDLVRPGPPEWDLAHAVWTFVPLYTDEDCARIGLPIRPRGPRLRLLCDGYELEERSGFLDVVRAHLATLSSPFAARSIPFLDAERDEWERHLG